MRSLIFAAGVCLLLAGCSQGDSTVDGSSDETLEHSLAEMANQIQSKEKRDRFQESLGIIMMSGIQDGDLMALASMDPDDFAQDTRENLDGMTVDEVIDRADQIVSDRKEREKKQALIEIDALEEKLGKYDAAKGELERFTVDEAIFYIPKGDYSRGPVIDLTVANGTEHPVSRAYFHGVVASPDRAIPWISEDFNYKIPGGIEPGETLEWKLSPNSYGPWGTNVPDDAIMTVTVERLDGADGEALWDAEPLSEEELSRLEKLKKRYQKD